MVRMRDIARRFARTAAIHTLSAAVFGLEVLSDLTPGVRMTGRRRLPQNMAPGIFAAEIATWAAVSPSLLPRPWWVTAANVAIGQAAGHFTATTAAFITKRGLRYIGKRPQDRVGPTTRNRTHLALGAITLLMGVRSLRNQETQAKLVDKVNERGPRQAAAGMALGTAGYAALLILGEATQATTTRLSHAAQRFVPRWVAWPVVIFGVAAATVSISDRMVWRRFIRTASLRAERVNKLVFYDSIMPWEPERSGSPWSHEPWTAIGAQGRRFVTRGPRARDIAEVMGTGSAREPIRIVIGLVPGRSLEMAAAQAIAEMERTGAFRRDTIVIQMPAGSGWLNNYSACAHEFLTRGDCATVTVQYSYLPSVFSFLVDRENPVAAAGVLIDRIRARIDTLPADDRPKLYFSGESLGAYAIVENYHDLPALLAECDGAVLTGPPRITSFIQRVVARRERSSLERLPVVDSGRHIRFVPHPQHLDHDAFAVPYPQPWQRPRIVVAQHASDAIVWWDGRLAYARPAWIHEAVPPTLRADTFRRLTWFPFITFWQLALDQINSLNVPGGHGHNYFEEMFFYWDAVLGSQSREPLTEELAARMTEFVRARQKGN